MWLRTSSTRRRGVSLGGSPLCYSLLPNLLRLFRLLTRVVIKEGLWSNHELRAYFPSNYQSRIFSDHFRKRVLKLIYLLIKENELTLRRTDSVRQSSSKTQTSSQENVSCIQDHSWLYDSCCLSMLFYYRKLVFP